MKNSLFIRIAPCWGEHVKVPDKRSQGSMRVKSNQREEPTTKWRKDEGGCCCGEDGDARGSLDTAERRMVIWVGVGFNRVSARLLARQ